MDPTARKFVLALSLLVPMLPAQVPEGWTVLSRAAFPGLTSNLGGLVMHHPRSPDVYQNVVGLGSDLTGAGAGDVQGAACVLYRESDGLLLVGEHAPAATAPVLGIHAITLIGGAVASDVEYPIGTVNAGAIGSIDQMTWLSDTQVLFTHLSNTTGPMTGYNVGILNLTTGLITPVLPAGTGTGQNGQINALAVNPAGTEMYVGRASGSPGAFVSRVYRVPLPAGSPSTLLASFSRIILQLATDASGRLFAGRGSGSVLPTPGFTGSDVLEINTVTGAVTQLAPMQEVVNSLSVERATGHLAFTALDPSAGGFTAYVGPPGGPYVNVGPVSVPFPDPPTGCVVNSNMDRYGAATPGMNSYWIDDAPNPGGLAIEGNLGFSITVRSTPASVPGVLGMALAPASFPLSGIQVLVDPAALFALVDLPASPAVTIPLGIPAGLGLSGIQAWFQAAFADPNGLASTSGLRVTVL